MTNPVIQVLESALTEDFFVFFLTVSLASRAQISKQPGLDKLLVIGKLRRKRGSKYFKMNSKPCPSVQFYRLAFEFDDGARVGESVCFS